MNLDIQRIPIKKINPAPYNPRKDLQPGDAEYEKLKRSLMEFGCVEPLVWNERTGNLVGGHQRFKVQVTEGMIQDDYVEVSVVNLDDDREKALNIALNKITGAWDDEKLAAVLGELQTSDLDLLLTGFDEKEAQKLIDSLTTNLDIEEEIPDIDTPDKADTTCTCPNCGHEFNPDGE